MNRLLISICVMSIIINIITIVCLVKREDNEEMIIEYKTDTLYVKRDSIVNRIDTLRGKIRYIDEKYKKALDDIIFQSADSDYVFFARYLERQFGNNNNATAQAN